MPWQQLKIHTTAEHAELLSDLLTLMDAVAVTFADAADQALLEPKPAEMPLWQQVCVIALFTLDTAVDPIIDFLQRQLATKLNYQLEILADQTWELAWLADFKPMQFGDRLWVYPSHETIADTAIIPLILDPGLAFGTGTHATTALCLRWLDKHVHSPITAIDYGCGSGILALAALKLGAAKVWAVDYDIQALDATRANAEKNHINSEQLTVVTPAELSLSKPVDLIIANILAKTLCELAELFAQLVRPQGNVVLSGILSEQVAEISQHYEPWFRILETNEDSGWISIVAQRHC